jgi:UDP-MurNAc hydroxylase
MKLTYLGHAGFLIETPLCLLLLDPWLSSTGAYDAAWFQYPCNHQLEQPLLERLAATNKPLYIYISHGHQDHYDLEFLKKVVDLNPHFILPKFTTPTFRAIVDTFLLDKIVFLANEEVFDRDDFSVTLYLEESGINRDSAILVESQGQSFLNLNDCKIFDKINYFQHQKIDVFTTQFSGATWHPICYEYDRASADLISIDKRLRKFKNVAQAIKILQPAIFIPSAGPCCFLDPDLFHLNSIENGIFPTAEEFLNWLHQHLDLENTQNMLLLPGDSLKLPNGELEAIDQPLDYHSLTKEDYLFQYYQQVKNKIEILTVSMTADPLQVFENLGVELSLKCQIFGITDLEDRCLYFGLTELTDRYWKVDLQQQTVSVSEQILDREFYSIVAPAWQVERVLKHEIHWEDFCLSFRSRLRRVPDLYSTVWNLFLFRNADELTWAAQSLQQLDRASSRVRISCPETAKQWEIRQHCPHQGADLAHACVEEGRYLICPRHGWKFDLENAGKLATGGKFSIKATPQLEQARTALAAKHINVLGNLV